MKNFLLVLFLSGLYAGAVQAQLGSDNSQESQQNLEQLANISALSPGARGFDNRYEGVKGTPYLFEDWREGYILVRGNSEPSDLLPLNFDQSENMLLVVLSPDKAGRVSADQVESVVLPSSSGERLFKTFTLPGIKSPGGMGKRFYEVLHEGDFLLLKDHQKRFQKADYKGAYTTNRTYDEFLEEQHYFVRAPGEGNFEKVSKLNRKKLEKILPGYKDRIRKLAKENNWELDSEKEVIALISALAIE